MAWRISSFHYLGGVNGVLVIGGQILKPWKEKIYSYLNWNENTESVVLCKRATVFWLITLTWVFFNKGISESIYIIKNIVLFNPINFFDPNLWNIGGNTTTTLITVVAVIVFVMVQIKRQNEGRAYVKYIRQPFFFQVLLMAFLICICIFSACATDASVNSQFVYFQF